MGRRMYYILKIIYEHEDIIAKNILVLLEKYDIHINIKTVYDAIDQINEFFFDFIHDDLILVRKKIGYSINKNIFSDGQLQLLLDSITYHQDLKRNDKEELKDILLKLSSSKQRDRLIINHSEDKELSFSLFINLNTIMKAIEEKKTISFEYINYQYENNQFKEVSLKNDYIISPYKIVLNNNHYYIIGYFKQRKNELSIYRIDRMRYIMINKESFVEIREKFNMEETIHNMMNMFSHSENIDLTIEFHQSILREIISKFTLEYVEKIGVDWYKSTIKDVQLSDGLIGWIMMLQDKIKVISPYSLRQEMKNRINKMIEMYE